MKKEKIHLHYLDTKIVLTYNPDNDQYTVRLKRADGTKEKQNIDQDAISTAVMQELARMDAHSRREELKAHIKEDMENGIHLLEIEYSNIYDSNTMLIKSKIAQPTHQQLRAFIPELAESSIDDVTDDNASPSMTYCYISNSFNLDNYEKWPILE